MIEVAKQHLKLSTCRCFLTNLRLRVLRSGRYAKLRNEMLDAADDALKRQIRRFHCFLRPRSRYRGKWELQGMKASMESDCKKQGAMTIVKERPSK